MLKGAALNYYYTSCKINPRISSLVGLCEIRSYFEGPEHERNKPECWSNRHSQEERDKARDQYKAQLDRSFNHRLDQYVANIEGKDEGEEEDLMDEFEALIIDSGSSPPEPTLNHTFITELARIFNSRMLTQTPTIQRAGQRLVLSYGLKVYMRDISQAYTQPETNLARNFFIRPPKELNLPDGLLLKVLHPLYTGSAPIAAAVYISRLEMKQSYYGPCLLFTSDDGAQGQGIVDTLIACDFNHGSPDRVRRNSRYQRASPPVIMIAQSRRIQKLTPIPLVVARFHYP